MDVHPIARRAGDRLGHESREAPFLAGNRANGLACGDNRVGHLERLGGREIEFVLPAANFVMAGFDHDAHLTQRVAYPFADHAGRAIRRIKITRLVVGMQP